MSDKINQQNALNEIDPILRDPNLSAYDKIIEIKNIKFDKDRIIRVKDSAYNKTLDNEISILEHQLKSQGEISINQAFTNVYKSFQGRDYYTSIETLPVLFTTIRRAINNLFTDAIPTTISNQLQSLQTNLVKSANSAQKISFDALKNFQQATAAVFEKAYQLAMPESQISLSLKKDHEMAEQHRNENPRIDGMNLNFVEQQQHSYNNFDDYSL